MSLKDFIFTEDRARLGSGSGLYIKDSSLGGKYRLLVPTVNVPFTSRETGEIEIKVVTSDVVGKTKGVDTLNSGETDFYLHRDSIEAIEKVNGTEQEVLFLLSDFSGYRQTATITYTPSSAEMDGAITGSITVTPKTALSYEANCLPLLIPTASFKSVVPAYVELSETTGKYELTVEFKHAGTTLTAKSSNDTVVTASVTGNKLTITGKAEGSTLVRLTSSLEGFAPWNTSILVVVPKASA